MDIFSTDTSWILSILILFNGFFFLRGYSHSASLISYGKFIVFYIHKYNFYLRCIRIFFLEYTLYKAYVSHIDLTALYISVPLGPSQTV